jgi:hypothetical protein
MNKIILFVAFLLLFPVWFVSGQSVLSISPADVEETFRVDISNTALDLQLETVVTNTSSDTLMLRWERMVISQPQGWLTQVCDNNFCYEPPVFTNYSVEHNINEPVVLLPGTSFKLIFHVLPKGEAGSGTYELPFYRIEAPEVEIAKATFKAIVGNLSNSSALSRPKFTLFPNPASEYFEVTGAERVDQVILYNLVGRMVKTFQAFEGRRYFINDLPDGLYLVSFVNFEKGVLRTSRLSKRSFRP